MPVVAEPSLDLVGTWVRVLSLRTRMFAWYDRNRRDLPWRRDRDPYRVLVSEMMLQQTRVDVVVPYFERWMERWPTLRDLADASEDDVLAAWSGLGYYRRARALHAVAREVVDRRGGEIPRDAAELRTLPGIGPYTAAAVASIAYDVPVPVVDGNVERVLCRLLADTRERGAARGRTVAEAARRLVTGLTQDDAQAPVPPEGLRAGDWNQAMMELGATVCLPSSPRCVACPWTRSCLAQRAGLIEKIPRPRERRAPTDVTLRAAVVRRGDAVLLVRRAEGPLLAGLWELPTTQDGEDLAALAARVSSLLGRDAVLAPDPARTFRHTITHRRITVHVHEAELAPAVAETTSPDRVAWVRPDALRDYGVSSMTHKSLRG